MINLLVKKKSNTFGLTFPLTVLFYVIYSGGPHRSEERGKLQKIIKFHPIVVKSSLGNQWVR